MVQYLLLLHAHIICVMYMYHVYMYDASYTTYIHVVHMNVYTIRYYEVHVLCTTVYMYHTCTKLNGVYGKYGYDHRPDRNVGIAELHVNIEIT